MGIKLSPDIVKALLPVPKLNPGSGWNMLKPNKSMISPLVNDLLPTIHKLQMNFIQFKFSRIEGQESENDYGMYLQYPNNKVKTLAMSIVDPGDTNDEKAYKIMRWVQENIEYKSDMENYKQGEFWALPTLTLSKSSGDCEDGAFLMHSLMLNAGIPWENIRTYGGLVISGTAAEGGGHAWTSYKRETDDEWVVLDWCYFPTYKPIADRSPMKNDIKYIDDFFFVNVTETIETPYANKVKNPALAYNNKQVPNFLRGQRINVNA